MEMPLFNEHGLVGSGPVVSSSIFSSSETEGEESMETVTGNSTLWRNKRRLVRRGRSADASPGGDVHGDRGGAFGSGDVD